MNGSSEEEIECGLYEPECDWGSVVLEQIQVHLGMEPFENKSFGRERLETELLDGAPGNGRPLVQIIGHPEKMVEKHHYKELPDNVEKKPEGESFEKVRVDKVQFEEAHHE
jgi:hypothetical protein